MDTVQINKIIKSLLDALKIRAKIEHSLSNNEKGEVLRINILTQEDAGLLIGPGGEHLDDLQRVARIVIRKQSPPQDVSRGDELSPRRVIPTIVLDVNDYRKERQEFLKRLAKDAVDKACLGERTELEPMSSFERRIIHLVVADSGEKVASESVGEERERRVVISPLH